MAASSVEYQTGFAPVIAPYAETMLGKAQLLTDTGQTPYQTYQGGDMNARIAQFTDLQKQAFEGAGGMQGAPQMGTATGMATQAGLGALGAQYNPYATGQWGQQAGAYMDPYMQNVVDIQQREAQRQADIAGTQQQARATQSGAFGGSRDAIMRAEAARNLATQKGDIQAQGLEKAYQSGMGQFNTEQQLREQSRQYGAGLGMQGFQTALQGAGQLGQLGQQQFGQGLDVNKLQQQYGTQQQQQVQNTLGTQYQDWLNQQNDPYKRMSYMSDIIRGAPLSQTGKTQYEAPPSMLNTVAGLGTIAYGAMKASGGVIRSPSTVTKMAKGGLVKSPGGLASLVINSIK